MSARVAVFVRKARELGYHLIILSYRLITLSPYHLITLSPYLLSRVQRLADDCGAHDALPTLPPDVAWTQCLQLRKQQTLNAEYIYRRNHGMADSLYRLNNSILTADYLGIAPERAASLMRKGRRWRLKRIIKNLLRRQA